MRHLRPLAALLTIAALTVACSPASSGAESQGSEPSTGSQPSQAAASSGGGGGGGANGSITYEITGDFEASGELPFLPAPVSTWIDSAGGWVASFANSEGSGAYVLLNTQAAEGTPGQSFTFGDGSFVVTAVSGDSGMGCTFDLTKNDSSGLSGELDCTSAFAGDASSPVEKRVKVHAEWDAHP